MKLSSSKLAKTSVWSVHRELLLTSSFVSPGVTACTICYHQFHSFNDKQANLPDMLAAFQSCRLPTTTLTISGADENDDDGRLTHSIKVSDGEGPIQVVIDDKIINIGGINVIGDTATTRNQVKMESNGRLVL